MTNGVCARDLGNEFAVDGGNGRSRQTRSSCARAGLARSSARARTRWCAPGRRRAALYQQGAAYANGEFIQVHPTAIPGDDKLRLMSESRRVVRVGACWVPRDKKGQARGRSRFRKPERWYFLEEKLSEVRQSGAARYRDARDLQGGVRGTRWASTGSRWCTWMSRHLSAGVASINSRGFWRSTRSSLADDPRKVPMKIFPGMHYTMGGLWVDFDQQHEYSGHLCGG